MLDFNEKYLGLKNEVNFLMNNVTDGARKHRVYRRKEYGFWRLFN